MATVNEYNIGSMVWITKTGSKYHSHGNCGNSKYVSQVTRESAEARGLDPCSKCYYGEIQWKIILKSKIK